MQIQCDTREHSKEWDRIRTQFDKLGVSYFRSKLYVGDYMSLDNPRLVIDRKKDLQEICGNVTQQHERFKRELIRAQDAGIRIIILCEHGCGIECLEDIFFWKNPRRKDHMYRNVNGKPKRIYLPPHKRATSGRQLYRSLSTIQERYNVTFEFCKPSETGQKIVEILSKGERSGYRESQAEH